jgi:hypothetical protein
MKQGDTIYAPPDGRRGAPGADWVRATVDFVGRRRIVRDPTSDRDHRPDQWVTVRYEDGSTSKFEYDLLDQNQKG